jgi:8-oxo-dGTP diphosphatase
LSTEKKQISLATDMVLFRAQERPGKRRPELQVLLLRRAAQDVFAGKLSLPGGFVSLAETLDEAVLRQLREKTGVTGEFYFEQLYTHSALNRDPRGRVVSCSFLGIANPETLKGELLPNAVWVPVPEIKEDSGNLAFDHHSIINYALGRMAGKVEYTDIAFAFLPEKFTVFKLQNIVELLLGREISNFRRKISDYIEKTSELEEGRASRPARLFRRNEVPRHSY